MRTKTLILSAVALAASILYSDAQVYSANVVGYYNVTVPAKKRTFLQNSLTNGGDICIDLVGVSDNAGSFNTSYNLFNNDVGATFTTYNYFTDQDAQDNFGTPSQGNGWYDGAGNIHHTNFPAGRAAYIINPRSTNITMTIVGQVIQGVSSITINKGYNGLSLFQPVATNITTFAKFPGHSDAAGSFGDSLNVWDNATQGFHTTVYFTDQDAQDNFGTPSQGNGFYDGNGIRQDLTNAIDNPIVGGAWFLIRPSNTVSNWTYSFSVQ